MPKSKKDETKDLKKKLEFTRKSVWDGISKKEENEIYKLSDEYKKFLDSSKTERIAISNIINHATKNGFVPISKATIKSKKVFINTRGLALTLAYIKDFNFKNGFNIIASHVDVPRLDLKSSPLYESEDMAFMKTHYYGGIKKYQWVTRPLSLHGVVIKTNGDKVNISIGEKDSEPVFTINDLLPHLAQEQITKTASKVIEGEQLNILVGSVPYKFKSSNSNIKLNVLDILFKKYGIKEEDFTSAELQVVPAGNARDVGFDISFVGAHGQDDRACSFISMKALFDTKTFNKNTLIVFFDKEEVGSFGDTGANSNYLERIVGQILDKYKKVDYKLVLESLENSKAISADVVGAIDPEWRSVNDAMNAARVGNGAVISKYGGVRGKASASEAHGEFIAEIRKALSKDNVIWHSAELGKVDQGGGGTVAKYLAYFGMDVLDMGLPLLAVHSPFEIASKGDLFHAYKALKSFLKYV
jgi:aspartyl aminopeptidase